jgi:tetratricopeptide (TPR) repeat protein
MKRVLAVFLGVLLVSPGRAESDFDAARALLEQKQFTEARAAFEKIVAADPTNAAACYYLGRAIFPRRDTASFEEAAKWLGRAVELEPNNARYLGEYGGTSLQLAERTNSFFTATKGRDAMEKALVLDPDYLEAREGLFQFYQRAPWPLGSAAKAAAQLEAIRKRDPERAIALEAGVKANAKDFPTAFTLCDTALAKRPDSYLALYQFGRTASLSGQNLERGLACLQRCLALEPHSPAAPSHSYVWLRIARIHEQLNHAAEARAAYEAAVKLDPANKAAAEALARLR